MTPMFKKLNLKDQNPILVLNAPSSFEPELAALEGVTIHRRPDEVDEVGFALVFVVDRAALDAVVPALVKSVPGDVVLWFAYPKLSSKRYRSDLNRDEGWAVLSEVGFRPVRQVAVDEDWSAVRFRRTEYSKPYRRND